jgi:hypothetical protein
VGIVAIGQIGHGGGEEKTESQKICPLTSLWVKMMEKKDEKQYRHYGETIAVSMLGRGSDESWRFYLTLKEQISTALRR